MKLLCLVLTLTWAYTIRRHDPTKRRVVVHITANVDPDFAAAVHNMENLGEIAHIPGHFVYQETRAPATPFDSALIAAHTWQIPRTLAKRGDVFTKPADPQYEKQWHLFGGGDVVPHLNVEGAWKQGVFGQGVLISVVDDGVQFTHPDLMENYDQAGSYDWNDCDSDVTPHPRFDDHGTPAAGLCCGARNGAANSTFEEAFCGVGVAYMARVSGLRLIARDTEDWQEAHINWAMDRVDVYSNSWGPTDDGNRLEGPGPLAAAAVEQAIAGGRGGKGSIYVFAGGNGRSHGDNCNYDGWANWRYTITIAAVQYNGKQPWYSEDCSALIASVPSSGGGRSITTTDLLGTVGTSQSDCTSSFSGTSAAAPMAAGGVALILDANPRLGWRDVQGVIIDSVVPVDPTDVDWKTNGAGHVVNHKYGFGSMELSRAVQLAKAWLPYQTAIPLASDLQEPELAISPGQRVVRIFQFSPEHVPATQRALISSLDELVVEHVELNMTITTPNRGQLAITLVSPHGTASRLQEWHHDRHANIVNWRYQSIFNWGETPGGQWHIMVDAQTPGIEHTWTSYHLLVHCHLRKNHGKPESFFFENVIDHMAQHT